MTTLSAEKRAELRAHPERIWAGTYGRHTNRWNDAPTAAYTVEYVRADTIAPGVTVRALEWVNGRAKTVLGRYLVGPDQWGLSGRFEMRAPFCGGSDTLATEDDLPSLEAAKAAAQAHFEEAILSTLTPKEPT